MATLEQIKADKDKFIDDLVRDYEGDYTREQLERKSPKALLELRLHYEGIINYTGTILRWVNSCYGTEL